MNHELDPRLRVKAERILETKSEFKGEIYWRSRAKRALDILISTPSLVPILPIISVLGIAIFIDDGHWPFFSQQCGHPKEKKPFHKLRTMLPHAQQMEFTLAAEGNFRELQREGTDFRISRIGRFLRRTSLDESPQFLNIALGHCSLVGPRPFTIPEWQSDIYPNQNEEPFKGFIELLNKGIKWGVTGFYGIFGRKDLNFPDRLGLEVLYGEKASFKGDLRILALTIPAVLSGEGAV